MVKFKRFFKEGTSYFLVLAMMFSFLSLGAFVGVDQVHAVTDFKTGATVGTGGTGQVTEITTTLKEWILVLRIIGAVIAVAGAVIGAIMFSVSLGNAQNRAKGTGAMLAAIVGIIIIAKAPSLADYFIAKAAT
ncbi:hypothetical protein [Paenibacillus agricola]|uniref:TrbC/VIRB2 family protein n=1 Tax=Paenibacillus agricola TaxID=2716264 RepID=A0ABX0JCP1_9BACL|nr:hypothetical protein [Paenibacillus agricola]NHN33145.1 hypothetical protein [Paenibacillus agricola]